MTGVYETILEFLTRGGNVMVVLSWVVFIMWTLIIERLIFMFTENRVGLHALLSEREKRLDRHSWHARVIYDAAVSRVSMRFAAGLRMIYTLARLCPLFGLMGTVTGMILIFDVMAITGSSSPRMVAAGVASATLTTMAGMVGALSGIFPAAMLNRIADDQQQSLEMHRLHSQAIILNRWSYWPRYLRFAIAPVSAFIITMGLIFLMQTLIATGEKAIQEVLVSEFADFVRVRKPERLETRTAKPKKIAVEKVPEKIDINRQMDDDAGGVEIDFSVSDPSFDAGSMAGLSSGIGSADSEYLPIVRVLPIYPRRAEIQGLEGWVVLEFTVNETGATQDIRVLESSNRMFEKAAVRSVEKYKYRPRVVNGRPVKVTGIKHKVTFEILE